ncbi:hypothetical protein Dsin_031393 [Dipteronia sinensis]|uniref:Uncharacterized protein n=1 Tax=Dipteronia sinensis TaxID=43782 RepID=A0AAD9ZL61_9ROSI|nr:hypothetical protein Dsin_031393 [Dipteronia sinensis]
MDLAKISKDFFRQLVSEQRLVPMAVTGDRRRQRPVDEDQGCYQTSSGNRELRFGRGCLQTSAVVDGGRSFPPTPLFSGPSDGGCRSRRWSAHQRSGSSLSLHWYYYHPPSSSSSFTEPI